MTLEAAVTKLYYLIGLGKSYSAIVKQISKPLRRELSVDTSLTKIEYFHA
jgi:uncharacterized protein YtpQ (UPF0354 family)